MQRVRLIFAAKQKLNQSPDQKKNTSADKDKDSKDNKPQYKLRVSLKNDWIYELEKVPEYTIGYTLKKFKIADGDEEQLEMAKKYRAYRVREDPKTRYRYVTEILNIEEGKQLVNKKFCQILICHQSLIKNPQEDFKNILDEAERKMLKILDEEEHGTIKKDRKESAKSDEGSGDKESQNSSSSSSKSSQDSKSGASGKIPRRNMGQKRIHNNQPPGDVFNEKQKDQFILRYPNASIGGKNGEYYKLHPCLDFVRETAEKQYSTMDEFNKKLIKVLNDKHLDETGKGNKEAKSKDFDEFYTVQNTPSYVNIRCGVSRKCRFAIWYKRDKNGDDENVNIKYFRTINNNHDLSHHKDEGIF